ncbi:MAG: prepilin-type N-terminal cleavage/methylation domain-containing protein [Smithellaceae bacterium]|nr:prepilin-type N-terminal cleavage/methylation domain-containing protein [Smithellaceae bacterium]
MHVAEESTNPRLNSLRAFTLIELVIVVLLISILILIAISGFQFLITRAFNVTAEYDLRNFVSSESGYLVDHNCYLGGVGDYIEGGANSTGPLVSPDLKTRISAGVRIEIVSGDPCHPSASPPYKAEATHSKASVVYVYDFSTHSMSERKK